MTTTWLTIKEEKFNELEKAIENCNMYNFTCTYDKVGPDEDGFIEVKIMATSPYYMFKLGVELGKITQNEW